MIRRMAVLLGLCLAPWAVMAQQQSAPLPTIVMVGRAEVSLSPSRATVELGVESHAATAAAASSLNAQRVRRVTDAIRGSRGRTDSLRSVGLTIGPNYDYSHDRKLVDYVATTILRVQVLDLDKLGAVLDAALTGGATNVPGITFETDSLDSGRQTALTRAIGQARRDAETAAAALGGRLGAMVELTTAPLDDRPLGFQVVQAGSRSGAGSVNAQRVVIEVGVQGRWTFVGAAR